MLQIQYAAPSLGNPDVVRDDSKTLFVRNLPFRASEQDIWDFFAQAGPVVDVRRQAADDGGQPAGSCSRYWSKAAGCLGRQAQ